MEGEVNWPNDFINKIICGDCLEVMKEMPDKSIDMVITSPPYWGLRDYGTGPDQLGLEPTPEFYIEHLTEIFNEAKRVLKKEGTLWLNIGDTYGGSGGDHKEWHKNDAGFQGGLMRGCQPRKLMPKCLLMVPERLAWSLIQNGWILRNKIIWYKPNAMPSSVTDRFSNRWEYIFLFSKSQRYYFDLDAVREPHKESSIQRDRQGYKSSPMKGRYTMPGEKREGTPDQEFNNPAGKNPGDVIEIKDERKGLKVPGQAPHGIHRKRHSGYYGADGEYLVNPIGKNPGDFWDINTQPFPEAHFAVFPEKLCEKPIKAGCPEEVCKKCGKARERITESEVEFTSGSGKAGNPPKGKHEHSVQSKSGSYDIRMGPQVSTKTIGWTSCNCNAGFEGGIVLDPFAGAGTALYVAKEMRRNYIGIDIKQEYCEMSEKRLAQGVL